MVNYQLGKIYKIVDNTNGNIYIGSTCEPILSRRLAQHKATYNQYLKGNYPFVTSFDILKNDNYEIVLLELYPCNSKDELHSKERFYIENNECINKYIPTRTIKECMKQYRKEHKDEIAEYKKQYREQNKEDILQYHKDYYKNNLEKIKQYATAIIKCGCGSDIQQTYKAKHFKSKKHLAYLESLKDEK